MSLLRLLRLSLLCPVRAWASQNSTMLETLNAKAVLPSIGQGVAVCPVGPKQKSKKSKNM